MASSTDFPPNSLHSFVASLPTSSLSALARLIRKAEDGDRLAAYRPYQKQREFHDAGVRYRERLFMAGNQLGKTLAGGMEWAMHLTGRYPKWWRGRRFEGPVRFWAAGVTQESTRDNPQRVLLGVPLRREDWGTGAIPRT